MAEVTKTGTIKSTTHTKAGSSRSYGFVFAYTNPDPPPPEVEVEFEDVDRLWYVDAVGAGTSEVILTYDDTPPKTIKGFTINR